MIRRITEWGIMAGAFIYVFFLYMDTAKPFLLASNSFVLDLEILSLFIAFFAIYLVYRIGDKFQYYQGTVFIIGVGLQLFYFMVCLHPWIKLGQGFELDRQDVAVKWLGLPCLSVSTLLLVVALGLRRISRFSQILLPLFVVAVTCYLLLFPTYFVNSEDNGGQQNLFFFTTSSDGPITPDVGDSPKGLIFGPDWSDVPYIISFIFINLSIAFIVFRTDEILHQKIGYRIFLCYGIGIFCWKILPMFDIPRSAMQWLWPALTLIILIIIFAVKAIAFKVFRTDETLRQKIEYWSPFGFGIVIFSMIVLYIWLQPNPLEPLPWLVTMIVAVWLIFRKGFAYLLFFCCELFFMVPALMGFMYIWPILIFAGLVPLAPVMILAREGTTKSPGDYLDIQGRGN